MKSKRNNSYRSARNGKEFINDSSCAGMGKKYDQLLGIFRWRKYMRKYMRTIFLEIWVFWSNVALSNVILRNVVDYKLEFGVFLKGKDPPKGMGTKRKFF
jgi:hypothetical protein